MAIRPEPQPPSPPPQGRGRGDPPGTLAPSLYRLVNEIDQRWPLRDRRTDGWYRAPRVGKSYGHNPDRRGRVHAYDLDSDGVNPLWIIAHVNRSTSGLWYIIWDRQIWSMTRDWRPIPYHGRSPHTNHLHIEVYHTEMAWRYVGPWGIAPDPVQTIGDAPGAATQWGDADYLSEITDSADSILRAGERAYGYSTAIAALRI